MRRIRIVVTRPDHTEVAFKKSANSMEFERVLADAHQKLSTVIRHYIDSDIKDVKVEMEIDRWLRHDECWEHHYTEATFDGSL